MTAIVVSVCIPARNEEATIGDLVRAVVSHPRADEVIVVDHASHDDTAAVAEAAGARVVSADDVLPEFGPALGKGDVLWRSLLVSRGDIVVWLDADLRAFPTGGVQRLVEPLLDDPRAVLVKGAFSRSLHGRAGEGGRVTELAAKPALRLLAPVADLVAAADAYADATGREIQYAWALLDGVNDRAEDVEALVALLRERRGYVNVIPWNPVPELPFATPHRERAIAFVQALRDRGLFATVRWSAGVEAEAACGQLRRTRAPGGGQG